MAELFINLENNSRLDTIQFMDVKGFPSFGTVTNGMEVVDQIYGGYEDTTGEQLSLMYSNRKEFLNRFPKLDTIKKAYLIKRSDQP